MAVPTFLGDWWERTSGHLRALALLLTFHLILVSLGFVIGGFRIEGEYQMYQENKYNTSLETVDLNDSHGMMIDQQFGIRLMVWIVELEAFVTLICCFATVFKNKRALTVTGLLLIVIEIISLFSVEVVLSIWIGKHGLQCANNNCFICNDNQASHICTAGMMDSGHACWLFERSYKFYCSQLIWQMWLVISCFWLQIAAASMSGLFLLCLYKQDDPQDVNTFGIEVGDQDGSDSEEFNVQVVELG